MRKSCVLCSQTFEGSISQRFCAKCRPVVLRRKRKLHAAIAEHIAALNDIQQQLNFLSSGSQSTGPLAAPTAQEEVHAGTGPLAAPAAQEEVHAGTGPLAAPTAQEEVHAGTGPLASPAAQEEVHAGTVRRVLLRHYTPISSGTSASAWIYKPDYYEFKKLIGTSSINSVITAMMLEAIHYGKPPFPFDQYTCNKKPQSECNQVTGILNDRDSLSLREMLRVNEIYMSELIRRFVAFTIDVGSVVFMPDNLHIISPSFPVPLTNGVRRARRNGTLLYEDNISQEIDPSFDKRKVCFRNHESCRHYLLCLDEVVTSSKRTRYANLNGNCYEHGIQTLPELH